MEAPHRLHQDSLHYNNRYPTSADAFAAPQGNSTTNCFLLYYLWDPALLPFSRTGRLELLILFPFPLSYLMETGAKNKRPQALPRAKESVMIPTLLMNIPEPANNTKSISVVALGFFSPASLSYFYLFLYFICYSRHGRKRRKSGWHTRSRIEVERKKGKMPQRGTGRHTHTESCVVAIISS